MTAHQPLKGRLLSGAPAVIASVGTNIPSNILSNQDLEKMVNTSDEWIRERTGIIQRRIAPAEIATSDLAFGAAQKAVLSAGITPDDLDLIIVCTATPDMIFPSTACIIQDRLSAAKAAAFDLSCGCTGFMTGLTMASHSVSSGNYETVLVVGAETLSRIVDWEDRNTCVLFGDGAGAVVVRQGKKQGEGVLSFLMGADGSGGKFLCVPGGGSRTPASHESVDQRLHYMKMNGKEVFKFAVKITEEAAKAVLDAAGYHLEEVDLFIFHQANIRILEAAAKRLGVPMEKVFVNVDRYGNTSSASIPIALGEAIDTKRLLPGHLVAMVGFGAGLTWSAALVRWV